MPKFDSISLDDLIEALNEARDEFGGEIKVIVGADYGDRGNTTQALDLVGEYERVDIEPTAYSRTGFAIVDPDAEEDEDEDDYPDTVPFLRIK